MIQFTIQKNQKLENWKNKKQKSENTKYKIQTNVENQNAIIHYLNHTTNNAETILQTSMQTPPSYH